MKKILVFAIMILLSVQGMASEPTYDPAVQVLVVLPSAGWDEESFQTVARELTTFDISWIPTAPDPAGQMISGREVQPLQNIADRVSDETVILVIGGEYMSSLINTEPLTRMILNASHAKTICAGIGNGTLVLGNAGILSGVKVSLPDEKTRDLLAQYGAIPEESSGVITDTIITAQGAASAQTLMEVLVREIIAREITQNLGVLYLGDQENGKSVYIVPERLTSAVVTGIGDDMVREDWTGEPQNIPAFNATVQVPALGDWILTASPENNVCLLYEQFTGVTVPYGSVVYIDTSLLGTKRDFSTNMVPVEEMIQDITFRDVYQNSDEYNESNKTLRNWTIEVNNTNSSVKKSVALLFDDIRIAEITWEDLTLRACLDGNGLGKGVLDILKTQGDEDTSLAYDEETVEGTGCYEVLLSVDAPKGITAYLTLFGKEGDILREKEIVIP